MKRAAAFLDRDGTIIRDTDFVGSPDEVELLDGAASAIRALNQAGIPAIVITNQSGIARGYFSRADYDRVQARLDELLRAAGARVDATYVCPHHPDITGPCECRKPGTLLFRQAAEELGLDLASSWYIGDKLRDVLPAKEFGGTGLLVRSERTPEKDVAAAGAEFIVVRSLDEAARHVIESTR